MAATASGQHEVQRAVNDDLPGQKAKENGEQGKSTCRSRKMEWRDPGEPPTAPSKNSWTQILGIFPS